MKRVFILSSHPLLGRGIETLLRQEAELEIVGLEKDPGQAIEQIKALQPDVILVDCNDADASRALAMLRLLTEGVRSRVVSLNLDDNRITIYQGEHKIVREVKDLVETIRD